MNGEYLGNVWLLNTREGEVSIGEQLCHVDLKDGAKLSIMPALVLRSQVLIIDTFVHRGPQTRCLQQIQQRALVLQM